MRLQRGDNNKGFWKKSREIYMQVIKQDQVPEKIVRFVIEDYHQCRFF